MRSGGVRHTVGKLSTKSTTFVEMSLQSKVCTQSYGPPKLRESQLWQFLDSHFGVPGQNDICVLVLWPGTKYAIRGKVVASSKFGLWWVLWIRVCPWFIRAPRCPDYALINLLFGLCKSVWVIELLVNLPSPCPGAPACPSTPEVLRTKERALIPSSFVVFSFGLTVESIKKLGGASPNMAHSFCGWFASPPTW